MRTAVALLELCMLLGVARSFIRSVAGSNPRNSALRMYSRNADPAVKHVLVPVANGRCVGLDRQPQ